MFNRRMVLTLPFLIAVTSVGIISSTNNEETVNSADGEDEFSETPFEYSNDTDADLRRSSRVTLKIKLPPKIQYYSGPTSDPCGTPAYQCLRPNSPYRTMDGTCNNLMYTARGSAGSAFSRLQKGRYANENGKIITKTVHGALPLPRVLSSTIFEEKDVPDRRATTMVGAWGQMVAHDCVFVQQDNKGPDGQPINCCTQDGQMLKNASPKCIPVEVPRDDPFFGKYNLRCVEMKRSVILNATGCCFPETNQISIVTHHLDLSNSYGNTENDVRGLRTFVKGQLMTRIVARARGRKDIFLPEADDTQSCSGSKICYKSGDPRVNQNLGVIVLQTIILREHNRIAEVLSKMHPYWDDETLFQESRRINIAQYEHITYKEFLPVLLGKVLPEKLHLTSEETGFAKLYHSQLVSSTMNEFTTAAFRSLHGIVSKDFYLTDEDRRPFLKLLLNETFSNPGIVEKKGYLDSLTRGLASQPCQTPDTKVAPGVSQFVVILPNLILGVDLQGEAVQSDRDHGLPTYNDMRDYCGVRRAKRFSDLLDLMTEKNVELLKSLYNHVDDIDFYMGGIMEKRGVLGDSSALVGYTFGCVIGEQFRRWKLGDRYFYDHKNQAGSFTLAQINGIKKTSLAALFCENLSIKKIQPNPFLQISERNKLTLCKDVQRMDLSGFQKYTPDGSCGRERPFKNIPT